MDNGVASNGTEQYAYAELQRILTAVEERTGLDPNEVYYTPADEPSIKQIGVRVHRRLIDAIETVIDGKERFKDRSEFLRHYIVMGLAIESTIVHKESQILRPAVIWALQENEKIVSATVEDIIGYSEYYLPDGEKDAENFYERMMSLLDYCKDRGWTIRIERIRRILMRVKPYGLE